MVVSIWHLGNRAGHHRGAGNIRRRIINWLFITGKENRMNIDPKKWYRPREIAKSRLITNSLDSEKESANYDFILELIKRGELKARNYSKTEYRSYWLVSGKEIQAYHDRIAKHA